MITPDSGGTVFEITALGRLTTLHTFDGSDGADPMSGLVQGTDGTFYGTTSLGGTEGYGTIFSLSVGLGPFVETLPSSGKVGSAIKILGTNLTGATSVTFNGLAATFTVVRPSEINQRANRSNHRQGPGRDTYGNAFEQCEVRGSLTVPLAIRPSLTASMAAEIV
jgi:uncharacterized repeat protein (TIGR03803 family)